MKTNVPVPLCGDLQADNTSAASCFRHSFGQWNGGPLGQTGATVCLNCVALTPHVVTGLSREASAIVSVPYRETLMQERLG